MSKRKLNSKKLKNYKLHNMQYYTVVFLQTLLSDSLVVGPLNSQSVFLLKT